MDKRAILVEYIKNCSNDQLDDIYSNLMDEPSEKMNLIINIMKPFLTYLYFSLSEEQIKGLFPKNR